MAEEKTRESRRFVDMWALPGAHPTNAELLQKLKTADSNRFNTHMDVVGTVKERDDEGKWQKTHLIGLRTDTWKIDKEEMQDALKAVHKQRRTELRKNIRQRGRMTAEEQRQLNAAVQDDSIMQMETGDIEKRRLVLKLFKTSSNRMRWCGTMEEMTTTEVQHSLGSRRNLLTLATILPGNDCITYFQQNHRTFRIPSVFTGGFHHDGTMHYAMLKKRWLSIGADFDVLVNGEPAGYIDGKLLSFGADSEVVLKGELAGNTKYADLMTLFAASVGYHKAMRKSVARRVTSIRSGETHKHLIESEEIRLLHNGRAAA